MILYQCTQCDYNSKVKCNVQRHMRSQHKIYDNLKRHMNQHEKRNEYYPTTKREHNEDNPHEEDQPIFMLHPFGWLLYI